MAASNVGNSRKTPKIVRINPHNTLRQSLVFIPGFLDFMGTTYPSELGSGMQRHHLYAVVGVLPARVFPLRDQQSDRWSV